MGFRNKKSGIAQMARTMLAFVAALQIGIGMPPQAYAQQANQIRKEAPTATPIRHVIVVIGENRTFDHVFATYVPKAGQSVSNLLSKGIVNADGTPGPNYGLATQYNATDTEKYNLNPAKTEFKVLPPPNTYYTPTAPSDSNPAPFATLAAAQAAERALPNSYEPLLLTGASGLPYLVVDTRIKNAASLPAGPFQLTPSVAYDDYAASPVHRFYQMWQEADCSVAHATTSNPSGCQNDLFPWVEVSIGAGNNGASQPVPFTEETTGEGGTSMAFYNMQQGDAPYLKQLADTYTISDNYHQAIMGGTGPNHIALGTGDAMWYSDGNGNALTPPTNEIENPDPQPGTNNWYTQDGYGGGSYTNCSDTTQPGVGEIEGYLAKLPYHPNPNCDPTHYYLLNNYSPGYFGDGTVNTATFVLPPSNVRTIGDELLASNITWKYYGEHWNLYLKDPHFQNTDNRYCDICNFEQYSSSIMTNAAVRTQHLQDVANLYSDIQAGTLPAVSFVKPSGFVDGHPTSSKLDLFEGFVSKVVTAVGASKYAGDTAIFITVDEGGGYYDSGYIQPLDFFGDGTRIPLIIVSAYTKGGIINHSYADHVSILKFIEKNWSLGPITTRSRDNLPNPIVEPADPYVPTNSPAIDDLMDAFQFPSAPQK